MAGRFSLFKRTKTAVDPVCHMKVDIKNPLGGTHEHAGTTYYFCGTACRNAFMTDPATHISNGEREVQTQKRSQGHRVSIASLLDPTAPLLFEVKAPSELQGHVDVEYQCPCGCRPGARYELGSEKAGSEHCCCGRVHFAGESAEEQLRAYMDERAKTNMDEDVSPYVYTRTEVRTPSGVKVPVAYAQPTRPRK
jgi:YHS domain-containing protein